MTAPNKKPGTCVPGFFTNSQLNNTKPRLRSLDVGSLLAFGTLNYFKGDLLAFFEGLEAAHVDCGKVREQIFAAIIGSDKTETLCVVEPFNCTSCHVIASLLKNGETPRETV
jgi:hypothetical protein